MIKEPLEVGRVVRSLAGRDAGRRFLVMEVLDHEYVLIADGDLRKAQRPKKKKRKHLEGTKELISDLQMRIANGDKIADYELRRALFEAEKMREECADVQI